VRILAAASRVFARHGVKDATMEMIAREAKVAVGTIYLHFSSRDEIYLALGIESGERLLERFAEVESRNGAVLEKLRAIAMAYVDHFRDPRYSYLLGSSINVAGIRKRIRGASEIRKFNRLTEIRRDIVGAVETTLRGACDAGLIVNPFGATMASAQLWAVLKGALELAGDSEFWRDVTGLDARQFIQQIVESVIATSRRGIPQLQPQMLNRGRAGYVPDRGSVSPKRRYQRK
jgi:AcrR family transcriptional regulator